MTDSDEPEPVSPFLGVPAEAVLEAQGEGEGVYAVGKAALAASRLESLVRGIVVSFMEYEAGQKLLRRGGATDLIAKLRNADTPLGREWFARVKDVFDRRGKLMHSSPSRVRMDGEWVDHLLQMRDARYIPLNVAELHGLAAQGVELYQEAIDAIGAEVFGAVHATLPALEGGFTADVDA